MSDGVSVLEWSRRVLPCPVAQRPTEDCRAVVAYRPEACTFQAPCRQRPEATSLNEGESLFARELRSCHLAVGSGNGPAACAIASINTTNFHLKKPHPDTSLGSAGNGLPGTAIAAWKSQLRLDQPVSPGRVRSLLVRPPQRTETMINLIVIVAPP